MIPHICTPKSVHLRTTPTNLYNIPPDDYSRLSAPVFGAGEFEEVKKRPKTKAKGASAVVVPKAAISKPAMVMAAAPVPPTKRDKAGKVIPAANGATASIPTTKTPQATSAVIPPPAPIEPSSLARKSVAATATAKVAAKSVIVSQKQQQQQVIATPPAVVTATKAAKVISEHDKVTRNDNTNNNTNNNNNNNNSNNNSNNNTANNSHGVAVVGTDGDSKAQLVVGNTTNAGSGSNGSGKGHGRDSGHGHGNGSGNSARGSGKSNGSPGDVLVKANSLSSDQCFPRAVDPITSANPMTAPVASSTTTPSTSFANPAASASTRTQVAGGALQRTLSVDHHGVAVAATPGTEARDLTDRLRTWFAGSGFGAKSANTPIMNPFAYQSIATPVENVKVGKDTNVQRNNKDDVDVESQMNARSLEIEKFLLARWEVVERKISTGGRDTLPGGRSVPIIVVSLASLGVTRQVAPPAMGLQSLSVEEGGNEGDDTSMPVGLREHENDTSASVSNTLSKKAKYRKQEKERKNEKKKAGNATRT